MGNSGDEVVGYKQSLNTHFEHFPLETEGGISAGSLL